MKKVQDAFLWRAAIKEYNKEAVLISSEVETLLEAVRMSPSSYGLQPYKVLVVENKEIREKLKTASFGQTQVTDASHFVVFVARTDENEKDVALYIENIAKVRGLKKEDLAGYEGMMNGALSHMTAVGAKTAWASKQAYLGLGVLLTTAALMEIDASPMEGFDVAAYDEILGLAKDGYTTAVICALGKRVDAEDYSKLSKVRKSQEDFIVTV